MHDTAPAAENEPIKQEAQAARPGAALNFPASQLTQASSPASEYFPATHSTQVKLFPACLPAGHVPQPPAPVAFVVVPGGHARHTLVPLSAA